MKILLTNDDGFDAEGLQSLYKVLSKKNEVWIMAPSGNRSGTSAGINLFKEMELTERGKYLYSLSGTPVDCVMAAFKTSLFPCRPDLVISGINHGGNLGTDIVYSGTCGAARQAAIYGIPSAAVSLEKLDWNDPAPYKFDVFSRVIAENLELIVSLCGKQLEKNEGTGIEYFVNINAPSVDSYKGVEYADICGRIYHDTMDCVRKDEGNKLILNGHGIDIAGTEKNDFNVIHAGCISVSRLLTAPACNNNCGIDIKKSFVL